MNKESVFNKRIKNGKKYVWNGMLKLKILLLKLKCNELLQYCARWIRRMDHAYKKQYIRCYQFRKAVRKEIQK